MKSVWIECSVPDDATPEHMAQMMEMLFKSPEDSVSVFTTQRAALDALRNVQPSSSSLSDLREAAAEMIHLSFDYGQGVEDADPWQHEQDRLARIVYLTPLDPSGPAVDVTIEILFEAGTQLVLDAMLHGNVDGPGRRLDPLLVDTEQKMQERLAVAERNLMRASSAGEGYNPVSPWYRMEEFASITFARDLMSKDGPRRAVATFRPGSSTLSEFRLDLPQSMEAERCP